MSAATSVPPSAGLSTRSRPSRAASRSASPRRPLPSGRAPPMPSSRTWTRRVPSSTRAVTAARRGASVFGDVGERLGDDEVGGRLDRGREPAHGHVDLDRHRHPRRQRVHAGAQPAPGEDRWEDAVGELAQLGRRLLGVVERLGQQAGELLLLVLQGAACQLERDDRVDQPLLRAVVQIANHAPALLVGRRHDPRPRRGELRPRFGVRDRRGHELRELAEPILDVGRAAARLPPRRHPSRPRYRRRRRSPRRCRSGSRSGL